MRGLWQEWADLVLPGGCAGCGAPRARRRLCESCRAVFDGAAAGRVRLSPPASGSPAVFAALRYADEVRAVLLAHKERGALPLAQPLGAALAPAVRKAGAQRAGSRTAALLLVPVPSARRAVAVRGHDPVRRLALVAAGVLRRAGRSARVLPVLRQRRAVADQAGLSAEGRAANLHGALEAVPGSGRLLTPDGPEPAEVVLVDDLVTTGASLAEAARVVRAGTGVEPSAAVVATRGRSYQNAPVTADDTGDFRPNGGTCQ
jgi:predicted amidophosphoribosyltransferase